MEQSRDLTSISLISSKVDNIDTAYTIIITKSEKAEKQGTPGWIAKRVNGLGGSEMKTFKGKDKYRTIIKLYKDKIDLLLPGDEEREDNIVMMQGHVFEDISKYYIRCKYNIDIVDINGPIPSEDCEEIQYSMDGLARIHTAQLAKLPIFKNYLKAPLSPGNKLVIFEFKSAYARMLNDVPDYEDQVYTGLYTFPQVDFCIFTDTCYKMCSLEQLYEPRSYARHLYDKFGTYHKAPCDPIAYSVSFFLSSNFEQGSNESYYGDICDSNLDTVEYIFGKFRDGTYKLHNTNIFSYEGIDQAQKNGYLLYFQAVIKDFIEKAKARGEHVVGFMPWKLYKINFVLYDRNDDAITPYCKFIKQFVALVKQYRNASIEEKTRSLRLIESIKTQIDYTRLTNQLSELAL